MEAVEHELDLLEHIAKSADSVHQRDLARILGLSLGMTNAIIRRLAHKGWITIRKVNNRNIHYAVTPSGIEQITRRSYRFFRRTIRNVVFYRDAIEAFVREIKARDFERILLIGHSDLDFIIEHACGLSEIEYVRVESSPQGARKSNRRVFLLYSENYSPNEEEKRDREGTAFLHEVVSGA